MEREAIENHQRYLERKRLYQAYGFDIDKERKFAFNKSKPLYGDILEVGSGKGHFALTLAKEGYKFIRINEQLKLNTKGGKIWKQKADTK